MIPKIHHVPVIRPDDGIYKPLVERLQLQVRSLEEELRRKSERPTPPPWPSKRSVQVVLTVHDRLEMAKQAYQSILDAGFDEDDIVVASTAPADKRWSAYCRFVDCDPSWTNNQAWLEGVKACTSSHVIILHDDDLMLPGLAEKLQERDDWEVATWEAESFGDKHGPIRYIEAKEGVYHGNLLQDVSARLELTISTIQGCFPRHLLIEAFEEWERDFSGPEFLIRPGMAVGNDLLLWLRAAEYKRVWVIRKAFSKCRNHSGSTTIAGERDNTIRPIYKRVRDRLGVKAKKVCIIGHLYRLGDHRKFLANLAENPCFFPIILMSPRPYKGLPPGIENVVVEDNDQTPLAPNYFHPAGSQYGTYGFANACKIAVDRDYDAMLYIENDVRVKGKVWEKTLWQEAFGSCENPWTVGTPVLWDILRGFNKPMISKFIRYAAEYEKDTGLIPAFEGLDGRVQDPQCLFTNGALTFYFREAMTVFSDRLKLGGLAAFKGEPPFDLMMGRETMRILGEKAFERVRWMRSSYSGCLNHYFSERERVEMLESGRVCAAHQFKA